MYLVMVKEKVRVKVNMRVKLNMNVKVVDFSGRVQWYSAVAESNSRVQ